MGTGVKKSELVDYISQSTGLSRAAAKNTLNVTLGAITTSLRKGGAVTLVGFGTFYIGTRAAKTGRHPQTGEALSIPAAKVAKFRAGKALKDAVK